MVSATVAAGVKMLTLCMCYVGFERVKNDFLKKKSFFCNLIFEMFTLNISGISHMYEILKEFAK